VTGAPIAYSIEDAGPAVGYSEWTIRQAIKNHELFPRFANKKGVILASELREWAEGLPLEPSKKEDKQ